MADELRRTEIVRLMYDPTSPDGFSELVTFAGYFRLGSCERVMDAYVAQRGYRMVGNDNEDVSRPIQVVLDSPSALHATSLDMILISSLLEPGITPGQADEVSGSISLQWDLSTLPGIVDLYTMDYEPVGCFPEEYASRRWGIVSEVRFDSNTNEWLTRKNRYFGAGGDAKRVLRTCYGFSREELYGLRVWQLTGPLSRWLSEEMRRKLARSLGDDLKAILDKRGPNDSEYATLASVVFGIYDPTYKLLDLNGALVGFCKESELVRERCPYERDIHNGRLHLQTRLNDDARVEMLRRMVRKDDLEGWQLIEVVEALNPFPAELTNLLLSQKFMSDLRGGHTNLSNTCPTKLLEVDSWQRLLRMVMARLEYIDHEPRSGAELLKVIRNRLKHGHNRQTGPMLARIKAAIEWSGADTLAVGGAEANAPQLLCMALMGYAEAVNAMTDLIVSHAERRKLGTLASSKPHSLYNEGSDGDELPDWARPERSYLRKWAKDALARDEGGVEGEVGRLLAQAIGEGMLVVMVFDYELYHEVTDAEMVDRGTDEIVSFPFPLTVIRVPGYAGIYGVTVFRWGDCGVSPSEALDSDSVPSSGYGAAFVLDGGCVAFSQGPDADAVRDRLVTYLDCDNAMIDATYVDQPSPSRRNRPSVATDADEVDWVRGADFVTGAKIVIEQKKSALPVTDLVGKRRAHFRRGFFRRQRVGSRDDWYYETRWIKPTFVHGSKPIITERRVRCITI